MLEVVNLVVGLLAIVLSVISIALSIIYSSKASATLDTVKGKADAIEKEVRDRLADLVKRAVPSVEERTMSELLPDLLRAIMTNPKTMELLLREVMKQGRDSSTQP